MDGISLFEPYRLGSLSLSNRIVMAPMTRNRALPGGIPASSAAKYYTQRASAGLLITEGAQICVEGQGYQDTPGIHTREQISAWQDVTNHVHAAGGCIFLQLWHVGRVSHVNFQPGGSRPVAPSAIRAKAKVFVDGNFVDASEPRELSRDEISAIVDTFRRGAVSAIEAGFDGVEIHGANGYLLDQFAKDGANRRTDDYGGSIENRSRFLLEVAQAVAAAVGAGRTGIRLAPVTTNADISDSNPQPLFNHIVEGLDALDLAFIHVVEGDTGGARDYAPFDYAALRVRFRNAYIANNGYTFDLARERLAAGAADLIAFGRPFIGNPDLVERLRTQAPLNDFAPATVYGGGEAGYSDYPALTG